MNSESSEAPASLVRQERRRGALALMIDDILLEKADIATMLNACAERA